MSDDTFRDSKLIVDNRLSNLQQYRIVFAGHNEDDQLWISIVKLDLVSSVLDQVRANLSNLKQKCVSDIQVREDLVVIRCDTDHTLAIANIKNDLIQLIYKGRVYDKDTPTNEVTYFETILIRHSSEAYQVYLQGDSKRFGIFTEVYEVFLAPHESRVF